MWPPTTTSTPSTVSAILVSTCSDHGTITTESQRTGVSLNFRTRRSREPDLESGVSERDDLVDAAVAQSAHLGANRLHLVSEPQLPCNGAGFCSKAHRSVYDEAVRRNKEAARFFSWKMNSNGFHFCTFASIPPDVLRQNVCLSSKTSCHIFQHH